jgi:hypothetical protein
LPKKGEGSRQKSKKDTYLLFFMSALEKGSFVAGGKSGSGM